MPKEHSALSWACRGAGGVSKPVEEVLPDILVQYCGSCGYGPRFEELRALLQKEFPRLSVECKEDEEETGNFEVFVAGELKHSKTSGDGWVDTPGKVKALKRAVRDATVVESVSAGVDIEVSTAAEVVVEGGQETRELLEEGDHDDDVEESNASLVVSMLTLVLSIPALIGACCWPALVIGLISGTVSSYARTLGHWISIGVTGAMMILLNWFMVRALKQRYIPMTSGHGCMGRGCQKYGPVILTALATPLIMAEPTRHVLGDTGLWPWCGDPSQQNGLFPRVNESWTDDCFWSSTEYRCDIPCCVPGNNSVATTNDLNLNYLLEVDTKTGATFQRSFSENCGLAPDRKTPMNIAGATYTNPNCTCAGGPCDMLKNPYEQMAILEATDLSLEVFQSISQTPGEHKQDPMLPMGFMRVDADTATDGNVYFGPFWPKHPQIDADTLAWIKDQTIRTGGGDESTPDCNCNNCMSEGKENMSHLSFIGWLFTIIFTYTGFLCLSIGTLWNADIIKKLKDMRKKWRLLRSRSRRAEARQQKAARAALLQNVGSKAGGDFI